MRRRSGPAEAAGPSKPGAKLTASGAAGQVTRPKSIPPCWQRWEVTSRNFLLQLTQLIKKSRTGVRKTLAYSIGAPTLLATRQDEEREPPRGG